MSSAIGFGLGVALGVWSAAGLRHQTTMFLVGEGERQFAMPRLVMDALLRLIAVAAVMSGLVMWSVAAALAGLIGYWLARTVYVLVARP